jgi:ubiquinone/menaquinone biosynthesis C-methylase UbiE
MHGSHSVLPKAQPDDGGARSEARVAALPWPLPVTGETATNDSRSASATRLPALPEYLVRHYWWAYLWGPAVWFFDHQPIINTIVFGQYSRLTNETLRLMQPETAGSTLLIASAYGKLIPSLAKVLDGQPLTVVDVAPIQLRRAQEKLDAVGLGDRARLECMNAEVLHFDDDGFDTSMMFLLLHELPDEPRRRALTEALRVTRPGGQLVLAEYGERTKTHWFHRLAPLRWIFGTAEPFLPSLWNLDLDALLDRCAAAAGKKIVREDRVSIFRGFYRVLRYRVEKA